MNIPFAPGSKPIKLLASQGCRTPHNPDGQPRKAKASPPNWSICWPRVPATSVISRTAGQWTSYAIISPSTPATSATRPCAASCRRGAGSINASPKLCLSMLRAVRKKSAGGRHCRDHPCPANGAPPRSLLDRCVTLDQCTLRPTRVVSQRHTSQSPHPCQAPQRHAVRGFALPDPAFLLETGRAGDVQDVPGISPPAPPALSRGAAPRDPRPCQDA